MQESSSRENTQQSSSRPPSSVSNSQWLSLSESPSQVDLIDVALTSARTLHTVRRGHLASSDPPIHRQCLEKALKNQLNRRLSQLSLTSTNQESLLGGAQANPPQEPAPENLSLNSEHLCLKSNNLCPNNSPRTSSPFDPTLFHHLAPLCPTSPSSSFDTVFFPDTPTPPAPIGEAVLALPTGLENLESRENLSETPAPSENLAEGLAMATLAEEEKKLKGVLKK